jgi:hypothetical protein
MAAQKPIPLATYQPATAPEPPAELGVTGSELWRGIVGEWDIADKAGLAVLAQACHAYDTAERLRRQIAVTGDEVETGNGGTKANPLIAIELQARSLTARLLDRLGVLDTEPKRPPGRPPKPGGW